MPFFVLNDAVFGSSTWAERFFGEHHAGSLADAKKYDDLEAAKAEASRSLQKRVVQVDDDNYQSIIGNEQTMMESLGWSKHHGLYVMQDHTSIDPEVTDLSIWQAVLQATDQARLSGLDSLFKQATWVPRLTCNYCARVFGSGRVARPPRLIYGHIRKVNIRPETSNGFIASETVDLISVGCVSLVEMSGVVYAIQVGAES